MFLVRRQPAFAKPNRARDARTASLDDVRRFWDEWPLGYGVITAPQETRAWFDEFDRIKLKYGLADALNEWIRPGMRGKRVLDVGCGPGFWARAFARMDVAYLGIDLSLRAVKLARKSLALYGLKGEIRVGNAESLEFLDESFDYVVSEGVIHHTPDTQACINEIHRVLVPGGHAAVSVYYENIVLRSRVLFHAALLCMRLTRLATPGRGRERMGFALGAKDLVRLYDGAENPIGQAYTEPQLRSMFARFEHVEFKRYFLPYTPLLNWIPTAMRRSLASRLGLMILVRARK